MTTRKRHTLSQAGAALHRREPQLRRRIFDETTLRIEQSRSKRHLLARLGYPPDLSMAERSTTGDQGAAGGPKRDRRLWYELGVAGPVELAGQRLWDSAH